MTSPRAYVAGVKLLVCVDFSPLSERVISEAIALAQAASAPLLVLHVAETEPALASGGVAPPRGHRTPPPDIAKRRAALDALAGRARDSGLRVDVELAVTDERASDAILAAAERTGATHVVIGSHGHAVVFELLVGSVTRGVLRNATIPVIVVPALREA